MHKPPILSLGILLLGLLLVLVPRVLAEETSFADAQKAVRKAFKRLDLDRPKVLEKDLRPRLPRGIVTEPQPFDALVAGLLRPLGDQLASRPRALEALAPFPAARAGGAVESVFRALEKEAKDLEGRIAEVEDAYAEVFDRGYMESSEKVRGTRKLAAVLIPFYRRLLLANDAAAVAASKPMAAWAGREGYGWVATRAKGASDPRLRAAATCALASVPTPAARSLLADVRASDRALSVRLEALCSLLASPMADVHPAIVEALEDDAWRVRALAIAACRRAKLLAAVRPMIDALDKETGRLRTDLDEALFAIVGVRLYGDAARWRQWWDENGADVLARAALQLESEALATPLGGPESWPTEEALDAGERERRGGTSSFYGIVTESRRVLFVVDISFSMNQDASSGPGAGGGPHATSRGRSKLDVAKEQLESALAGLPDEAAGNIVVYSESYATWQGEVVELDRNRKKVQKFIRSLKANGTTNIADALDKAFLMDVDTIFLLSDGAPNRGRITDLSVLLTEVLERNARMRFVFHTIGIGEAAGSSFLKALSRKTGGRYVEFR